MENIRPVRPGAPWIGGKSRLAKIIVPLIDCTNHRCYAEPFVGMGGVFLRRTKRPKAEVINDYNQDVANLFRILQRHYTPFMDMLRYQITSRANFERLSSLPPDSLTDLERAAQFLYLQRLTFGGKVTGRSFGVETTSGARFNISKLGPVLEDLHDRLAGVVIENLDFGTFLKRYDRPDTFFYVDPPYWGSEGDYGRGSFVREDFARLAGELRQLKGRFLLSINDRAEVRNTFAGFYLRTVLTRYTISGGKRQKRVCELLISNRRFTLPG